LKSLKTNTDLNNTFFSLMLEKNQKKATTFQCEK